MPRKKATSAEESAPDFERAIAELEEIVGAMEEEELPLEELVARFEKGTKLLTRCENVLASAKKRLQTIAANQAVSAGSDQSPETSANSDDPDDDDDIRLF